MRRTPLPEIRQLAFLVKESLSIVDSKTQPIVFVFLLERRPA